MTNEPQANAKYAADDIIRELSDGADLHRVMDARSLSPVRLMFLLDSHRGRQVLKARRRLARIHRELLANRFSAFAVNKLCAVLQQDKPELWLKAAAAVLEAATPNTKNTRKGPPQKPDEELIAFNTEEGKRLLRILNLGLEADKKLLAAQPQ